MHMSDWHSQSQMLTAKSTVLIIYAIEKIHLFSGRLLMCWLCTVDDILWQVKGMLCGVFFFCFSWWVTHKKKKQIETWIHLCQVTVPDVSAGNLRVSSLKKLVKWVVKGWVSCLAKLLWHTSFCVAHCGSLGGRGLWQGWDWEWQGVGEPLGPGPPLVLD